MAAASSMRKDLIFPQAGHFMFIPYGANGMPDMSRAYVSANGVVVSISRENSLNTVDLPDGNSPYPAATYVQTQAGTVTYVLSTYDPELEALIAGADYFNGNASDDEMWTILPMSVPAGKTKVFEDPGAPISAEKMVIKDIFGNAFASQAESASLTTGQFHYDSMTKTITFAEEDKDKQIMIQYAYKGTNVVAVNYQENPKITTFMAIVIGNTKDKDQSTEQRLNIVVDRCTVSGAVTPPTQSNDPTQGWTVTTNVLKPRSGNSPVKVKFEPVVE